MFPSEITCIEYEYVQFILNNSRNHWSCSPWKIYSGKSHFRSSGEISGHFVAVGTPFRNRISKLVSIGMDLYFLSFRLSGLKMNWSGISPSNLDMPMQR